MKEVPKISQINTDNLLRDSESSSTEECLWSYGSPKETVRYDVDPDVYVRKERSHNRHDKISSRNFRSEQDGILIYDSNARFADEEIHEKRNEDIVKSDSGYIHSGRTALTSKLKKEIKQAPIYDKEAYLKMKFYPQDPTWEHEYTLETPSSCLLRFNSKFESGNLRKAIQLSENEYNLILETDSAKSVSQWYYFSVNNIKPMTVKFNIINLGKFESLYNIGMLPLVKSKAGGNEWKRAGFDVSYYENPVKKSDKKNSAGKYYTLSFKYNFEFPDDEVYFSYSLPYTYQELISYLDDIKINYSDIVRVDELCLSLAGNVCPMITITEDIESYISFTEESYSWNISDATRRMMKRRQSKSEKTQTSNLKNVHKHKKGIIITSRVHSGETVSSYMMKGLIDFLTGSSREANILRSHYVFKIVPMLNPDGVRYGRTRCSLLGIDLNRRWANPNRILHPEIFYTKKMIQVFSEVHEVLMFCDLHGHSTKRNVFMYGCSLKSYDSSDKRKNLLARMVPILMSKNSLFSYDDSRFKMEKCKESTARIVVFKQFKIINSYTMEASFYGPSKIEAFQDMRTDFHMEQKHYESLGHELALVCLNFVSLKVFVKKLVYISTLLKEIDNQRSDFSKNVVVSFFGPEKSEILDVTDDDFEDITGLECSFKTQIFEKEEIWQDITFEDIYVSDTDSVISSVSAAEEFEFEITIKRKNPPKKQKIQMIDQTLPPRPKKEHVAPLSKRRVYRYENPKTEQEKSNNHIYATNGYVLKFNFNEDKSSRSHSTENIFKDNLRKPGRLAALSLFKNASPIQADHLQGTGLMHLLRKTQEKVSETVLEPHGIEIRNKSHEIYNSTVRRTVFSKSPQSFSEINQSSHRILANTTEDNQKKSKPRPSNSDNPRGGDLVKSFQKARLRLMMNSRSKKD